MAIKPLVLVFQELRAPTTTIVAPTLSGCVVGPHYHVRTYAEHKGEIFAGKYNVDTGTVILSLPSAVPGMKLKEEGLRVFLDNARVLIAAGNDGQITTSGLLTGDTNDDFVEDVVKAGDAVKITHVLNIEDGGTGDGDGPNPDRISIVGISATMDLRIGDAVEVPEISYEGVIESVNIGGGYIVVTPDLGTGNSFTTDDVLVERIRFIRDASTGQNFAVKKLDADENNVLQLATNFPFTAASDVTYEITRKVSAELLVGITADILANTVEIDDGMHLTIDELDRDILEYDLSTLTTQEDAASIYVEYVALDVTYANLPAKIETSADLANKLVVVDSRNPLGMGARVMYGNAASTIYAVGLNSEDALGWAQAVDVINRNGFYAQALLTNDDAIAGIFAANNTANAAPEVAQYGMSVSGARLPTTATPAEGDAGETIEDPLTSTIIIFEDATADFTNVVNPVLPGDSLIIDEETYIIDVVVNANRLKVLTSTPFPTEDDDLDYVITRTLSKDQQAESIAASSQGFGNQRHVRVVPSIAVIDGEDTDGFYACAAVAGAICGLPPQAGITNKGLAVIERVKKTNWDYFTGSQLDVMATGGTLIIIQDDENSIPYIRHQLTTDMDLLETSEISVVKNNDFLSLYFKGICKTFLGTWNVTPELIGAMGKAVQAGINTQKAAQVAKIGAPLIDAEITFLGVSDISPDRVEIYIETTQPRPLNTVGLHMVL